MRRSGHDLRISVIGIGYLGLTHAVCMADLGHQVLAVDVDADKIAKAARGEAPFFEPGLEPLLRKNLEAGRLRFTTSFAEIGEGSDVHFLCVGTPQAAGGNADLSYLHAATDGPGRHRAGLARPGPRGSSGGRSDRRRLESRVLARGVRGARQPDPGPHRPRRDISGGR
jgi:UDPglucose 6-dehydrogenase